MKAEIINPFLESARIVIEQVIQVSPSTGNLGIKNIEIVKGDIWIQVGMTGQLTGNVVFGLKEIVALKIVSVMMGGVPILKEMDEMGQSAISELGNMISGNASTILSNQGVNVDITPPRIVSPLDNPLFFSKKALSIPLMMDGIGELDIQVMIS